MALKEVHLTLKLPEELLAHLGREPHELESHVLQAVTLALLQEGKITASYAAELLGLSYPEMLDLLARHGIPLVHYDSDELPEELQALREP